MNFPFRDKILSVYIIYPWRGNLLCCLSVEDYFFHESFTEQLKTSFAGVIGDHTFYIITEMITKIIYYVGRLRLK